MAIWNRFSTNRGTTTERGQQAERRACRYLRSQGLKIIGRNFHSRGGEIDIIATDHEYYIFVEVRMRANQRFGGALVSVDRAKQQRLIYTAYAYLEHQQINPAHIAIRFDIIAFEGETIHWVKNAFGE